MYLSLISLTNASIRQPLTHVQKKINHFIIFDEFGQLAAGMTYMHVQLPLNLMAIYHQNDIIESNLNRILTKEFKSNIREAFSKAIKNYGRVLSKAPSPQNGKVLKCRQESSKW
jgi:hypothetical protein